MRWLAALALLAGCGGEGELRCVSSFVDEREVVDQIWVGNTKIGDVTIPNYIYVPRHELFNHCTARRWHWSGG